MVVQKLAISFQLCSDLMLKNIELTYNSVLGSNALTSQVVPELHYLHRWHNSQRAIFFFRVGNSVQCNEVSDCTVTATAKYISAADYLSDATFQF